MSLPLNLSAYKTALAKARLDLSAGVFTEDLHPRIHGKFAKKIGDLPDGGEIALPDGVKVLQRGQSAGHRQYEVHHGQAGLVSTHLNPKQAAKAALDKSARLRHKGSVGGTDWYKDFDAFKADPEHARQDKIDAKQKERLERSKKAGHGPGDMHSAIRNLMRAGAAGTLSADTQIDVEGFNAALVQARADYGVGTPTNGLDLAVFEERLHPRLRGKFTKKISVNNNHPDGGRGRTNDVRDQLKSLPVGGVGVLPSGVAVHRKEDKHFQVFKPDGTEVTTKAGAKTPHQAADNALLSHDFHESMKPIDHVRVVMEGAGLKPAGGRMTNPTFHKPVEVEGKGGKGAINATKQGNVSWSFENKHGKYTSGHEPDAATAIEKIKAHASASKEGEPKLDGTTFDRSPFEGPGREQAIQEELARLDNTDAVSFGRRLGNLSRDSGVPIAELRSKARKRFAKPDASGDHAGDAIDVGSDVNKAADLLSQGKHVVLDQPKHASVLLDELAKRVNAAKEKGDAAPNIDLCKVTVKNSNLFCAESKGIPRVKMPQLKGVPTPGSKADKLAKNDKGEVDLSALFREQLKHEGVKIEDTHEKAANLRASQIELNGAKVAGMTKALEAGKNLGNDPLFTSHDNYIVDGHHRWAANVGHDIADNVAGDISMPIARIDMDIIELLDASNKFASEWGIPQASVAATKPGDK